MSLTVRLLSRSIVAAATLLPIAQPRNIYAEESTNNITVTATESNDKEAKQKEELREFAYKNRYRPDITYLVRDPGRYVVDKKDLELAMGEPSNFFALGIGQNPSTIEVLKKDEEAKKLVKKFVLENLSTFFVLGLAQNNYPIDNDIQEVCRKKLDIVVGAEYFFAKKSTWKITEDDRKLARANYTTGLARGLCQHPDYVPQGQAVPEEDRKIMRKDPYSDFARVVSGLEGFTPQEKDISVVTKNERFSVLNTDYAWNVAKKLNVTNEHIKIAVANTNTMWADGIGANSSWKDIKEEHRTVARDNPDSMFAEALVENENFIPNENDIKFAKENPDTKYSKGVNEKLNKMTEAIIKGAKNGNVSDITDLTFDKLLQEAKTPVMVEFWAPWCGPCKKMAPVIKEIASDYRGKLAVVKLNVDKNPKITEKYSISSIPAILIFKNGKPFGNPIVGLTPKSIIIKKIPSKLHG